MNVAVRYTDSTGVTHARHFSISLPRFIKHFVLAGAGFTPTAALLARGMGAMAWYWDFVEPVAYGADCFGEPIPILRDPTLKAHFSNLAGRALADFLGREFEKSWATLSYEGALMHSGLPLTGQRPDLLAVNPWRVVALEAKGYAKKSVSTAEMLHHKNQAGQGSLPKHASAASVAYGLYDHIKVKYHDPNGEDAPPEVEATRTRLQGYFNDAEAAAEQLGPGRDVRTLNQRQFVAVPLPDIVRGRVPLDVDSSAVLDDVTLLIERDIGSRARVHFERLRASSETPREAAPPSPMVSDDLIFIDTDGIGISIAG